jgi:hypothetical protein
MIGGRWLLVAALVQCAYFDGFISFWHRFSLLPVFMIKLKSHGSILYYT